MTFSELDTPAVSCGRTDCRTPHYWVGGRCPGNDTAPAPVDAVRRRAGPVVTQLADDHYTPSHCAGTSCFHAHPGQPQPPAFGGLHLPVVHAVCDRKNDHGAHDTTEGRCPGRATQTTDPTRVHTYARAAHAAIRGGTR